MMQAVGLASRSAFSRHFHVECVINAIQHAVALPPNEVVMAVLRGGKSFGR